MSTLITRRKNYCRCKGNVKAFFFDFSSVIPSEFCYPVVKLTTHQSTGSFMKQLTSISLMLCLKSPPFLPQSLTGLQCKVPLNDLIKSDMIFWTKSITKWSRILRSSQVANSVYHLNQGGDTRIPLTRWSVGHVWQDKHQSGRFFVFIRQYARICLYMKRHDLGQNPNELLVTSLVCKVGLFYSSVSINQLFNTKNSFLQ